MKRSISLFSRCKVITSVIFSICVSVLTWLVLSENSPFDNYFLYHVGGRNLVGRLVFLPYVVVMLIHPAVGADQITYGLIFAQWLVVGFVLSILACKLR